MLAFIHIEKAAGQTFIRILENNFIYRHCRVAPIKKEHRGVFKWADLKILLRINPFLSALAGHSIVPYSDLSAHIPGIRYITILRDPIRRYISHYQYWVQALSKQISFEEFLSLEDLKNFQTKKIAGTADLTAAKRIIKEQIFLTGIVEEFDDFLIVLKKKLAPEAFDIRHKRRNVAKSNIIKNQIFQKYEKHQDIILNNNRLDMELYEFVKEDVFFKEKMKWIEKSDFDNNNSELNFVSRFNREVVGRIYRNLYIGPIINIIRVFNGLKFGGSY